MSGTTQLPQLLPPHALDNEGQYITRTLPVRHGYVVSTYEWSPPGGRESARGVLFSHHGYACHALFQLLNCDEHNHVVKFEGSLAQLFTTRLRLIVIAHDYPGHGRSTGLHGYVESHDVFRDAAEDVISHFMSQSSMKGLPIVLFGESMGGCNILRMRINKNNSSRKYNNKVYGVLISPAVGQPEGSFGVYGRFLKFIAPVLEFLVPELPVLKLPTLPNAQVRDAFNRDGLTYKGLMRVKMGTEFLRVYDEIHDNVEHINFDGIAIFVGGQDEFVSAESIRTLFDRFKSGDKQLFDYKDADHDVLNWLPAKEQEWGKSCSTEPIEDVIQWISNCISK